MNYMRSLDGEVALDNFSISGPERDLFINILFKRYICRLLNFMNQ